MSPARQIAFEVLIAVEGGAYASDLLRARSAALDARDAGLAAGIVFGVLRYASQLDFLLAHYSGRTGRLDAEVRTALRMGIYQLRYLDRVPRHAAVDESVDLVKRAGKRSAAGLVNAVLRKVDRDRVPWPDRSVELAHPEWLLARWEQQFGEQTMRAVALANLDEPATFIRVPAGEPVPMGVTETEVRGCYRTAAAEGYRQMDIGSQWVVSLLNLLPGQRFLDVCAAPGNKTSVALEAGVRAVACDLHWRRLEPMRSVGAALAQVNAEKGLPFRPRFDRILVDAPCSGTGTLARNPEIKWKLRPGDLAELAVRQRAILANAMACLAPGGRLVYATCSMETEENESVAGAYKVVEMGRRMPGRDEGDGFFAAVIEQP